MHHDSDGNILEQSSISDSDKEMAQLEAGAYEILKDQEPERTVDPFIEYVAKTATKFRDLPLIDRLLKENKELKDTVIKLRRENEELRKEYTQKTAETRYGKNEFQFEYDLKIKDQILPLTSYCFHVFSSNMAAILNDGIVTSYY